MKKLVYGAALLVVAAGSFAFLPKEGEPTGYMMLVTDAHDRTLFTISSDGLVQGGKVEIDRKLNLSPRMQIRRAELINLNHLRKQGWMVKQQQTTVVTANWDLYAESTTLLEKP